MTESVLRRPRRLPLPLTGLAIALLVAVPAWQLQRWPRPKAQGLEQLMAASSLLQSFQATPERPLPVLWRDRLGEVLGGRLWRLQRRAWWQFWGPHADGQPYLAIPEPNVSLASLARGSAANRRLILERGLRVGNLLVVAPDPLSKRLLNDVLRPRLRPARGLRRQCLQRLESDQTVFWNPTALGAMLGPLAPLFQRYQEGCLRLSLGSGSRLLWQGQTTAVDGLQAQPPAWTPPSGELAPLDDSLLLELRGTALQPLLEGLVNRELIREPLTSRYGLDAPRLEQLGRAPFQLRLRPLQQGPFQASVELQLALEGGQRVWQPVLERISASLVEQGLQRPGAPGPSPATSSPAAPGGAAQSPDAAPPQQQPAAPEAATPAVQAGGGASPSRKAPGTPLKEEPGVTLWTRPNGDLLGGWRWLQTRPGAEKTGHLVLFLGAAPPPSPLLSVAARSSRTNVMQLRLRPRALVERELMPPLLPELLKRADQAQVQASSRAGKGPEAQFSQLKGQLQVGVR